MLHTNCWAPAVRVSQTKGNKKVQSQHITCTTCPQTHGHATQLHHLVPNGLGIEGIGKHKSSCALETICPIHVRLVHIKINFPCLALKHQMVFHVFLHCNRSWQRKSTGNGKKTMNLTNIELDQLAGPVIRVHTRCALCCLVSTRHAGLPSGVLRFCGAMFCAA